MELVIKNGEVVTHREAVVADVGKLVGEPGYGRYLYR